MIMQRYTSESKPNGFTKQCRDCNKPIYLHRGTTDRWRAFEPAVDGNNDEWVRHRCPAGLHDADLMSLIAPAGAKREELVSKLKLLISDFQLIISQAEENLTAEAAAKASNGA